jgi:hypothetical protein
MLGRCLWFALVFPAALAAQHTDSLPSAGSIRGTVVDAASALPLQGATVTLGPSDASGVLPPQRGSYQLGAARTTVTKASGVYTFSDLSTGRYRLYVQRLGYEPVALDVQLRGSAAPDVSVGLVVLPVRLQPIHVQGTYDNPYGRALAGTATEGEARIAAAQQRQRSFLGTDVRELTYADVIEAATLGEADLFRALRRLPGVGGYDDFTTELWIRGATWSETRTTFDGLPLIEPMHASGTLAGVGTDAVGAAFLHPGVRPVSLGGDGAALVDLRSRPGGGDGNVRSTAELSLVGGHVAFDQRSTNGRYDWTVAARRSFDDVLPPSMEFLAAGLGRGRRAHYTEVSARGDANLGNGRALETSALFTNDYLQSFETGDGKSSFGGWGNAIVKSTLRLPLAGFLTEHSMGVSHFGSRSEDASLQIPSAGLSDPLTPTVFFGKVASADFFTIGGEMRPATEAAEIPWSVGYAWALERADYRIPRYLRLWGDLSEQNRVADNRLDHATLWGQRRWHLGSRLVAEGGVRLDAGSQIANTASVRTAPTLQLRYPIGGSTLLSAGAGRSFQYRQELTTFPSPNGSWTPGIPLLANHNTPAIVADQLNVGAEQWRTGGILLTANAYARRLSGTAVRTLPPDELAEPDLFTPTTVRSYGAEFGVRKLTGRVTGAINYSYNHATADDSAQRFTTLGDRPHSLDATAMTRLGGFRFGGAFTVTSGAPYTRIQQGVLGFDPTSGFFWRTKPTAGPLNAHRMPTFQSLDLLADWTFHVRGSGITTFVQVQNALDRVNLSWYYGSNCTSADAGLSNHQTRCVGPDLLHSPVERVGSAGIRVAF